LSGFAQRVSKPALRRFSRIVWQKTQIIKLLLKLLKLKKIKIIKIISMEILEPILIKLMISREKD